jgi:ubiquinol-cytochrome c reductase cytochrome c subunit
MPLADPGDVPRRKEPAYDDAQIDALVAFVASLGGGPDLPEVDVAAGDLAEGGELYRENCQACHSATGAGGALSYGRAAPPLASSTPLQVGAAVRSGPGPMPRFGPEILDQEQLDGVVRYVEYLEEPDDRGGLALGRLGPIPEGFLVWVGALGLLLVAAYFMGTRRATMPRVDEEDEG